MIVSELKKGICVIAALGMAILSNGIIPVSAEGQGSGETVFDPATDLTEQQYYFQSESGVVFPGWNQYDSQNNDSQNNPVANVTPGIVVAVVGTGVDYTHEDLKNVMWDDGDSEAYTALTALGGGKYGFNANGTTDKSNPMDETGDGTRAASIIAAEWNKKGISGALCGAEIMAVKTSAGTAVSALNYVLAAKNAKVNVAAVNLSSSVIRTTNADAISDLVSQLGEKGIITVISAGDKGTDLDKGSAVYETLRANPYVIVAAGTDESGAFWKNSSYGERNCSVLAPGENILAADITKASGNNEGEPEGETGETPAVSNNYTSLSGTSASAAIVTAAAAYLYDKLPDLKADERAARLIENAGAKDAFSGKVSGGLVNPEAASDKEKSAPLADHIIINEENADIRGYDFGTTAGTVKVDGERVSSSVWSSGKITVKADVFPAGEHTVEITRADNKSSSRKLLVDGVKPAEELPTDGLPDAADGFVIDAVTLLNDELYATGHTAEQEVEKVQSLYHYNEEEKKWEQVQETPDTFVANDSCSDGTYLYTIADRPIILRTKPNGTSENIYGPDESNVTDTRISYLSGQLIVSGTDEGFAALKECKEFDKKYKILPITTIEKENVRCIDVVETEGKLLAVCVETFDSVTQGEQLVVYEIVNDPETAGKIAKELFKEQNTRDPDTYKNAGAVSNGEVISVYRASKEDGIVVSEFSTDGKLIREVTVLKDAVSSVRGEIDSEGNLYLAGNTDDAEKPNFALSFKTGEKPAPTPTPTTTPTSEPTATPTSTPAPTAAPASKPEKTAAPASAPVSTVQTCQDAGFPAGWYWNESKKACVAPATAAPANNGTGGSEGNRPGGTNTGNGTNSGSGNNGAYSGTLTPEPTETPEATETPKPTETPEATEEPEKTAAPIEIINTKGILWFLGIPVLMILSGLAVFLTKNRGLIPWTIAGDAIGSIVLAILDHSVVGWILVVLNLAAVGLLALYRSGKQDEEDDEFEEE